MSDTSATEESNKRKAEFFNPTNQASQDEKKNNELIIKALNEYSIKTMKTELNKFDPDKDKIEQYLNKPVLFYDKDNTLLGFLFEVKNNELSFIKDFQTTTKIQKADAKDLFVLDGKNDNQILKITAQFKLIDEVKRKEIQKEIQKEMFKIVKDANSLNKKVFKLNYDSHKAQMNADGTIKTVKQVENVGGKINEKIEIKLSDDSVVTNPNNCYPYGRPAALVDLENCYYYFDKFTPT